METDVTALTALIGLLSGPLMPLLAAGAAYGGVKVALNGLKDTAKELERLCRRLDDRLDLHSERLTKLEVQTEERTGRK